MPNKVDYVIYLNDYLEIVSEKEATLIKTIRNGETTFTIPEEKKDIPLPLATLDILERHGG